LTGGGLDDELVFAFEVGAAAARKGLACAHGNGTPFGGSISSYRVVTHATSFDIVVRGVIAG
jgi:hypothetical protein